MTHLVGFWETLREERALKRAKRENRNVLIRKYKTGKVWRFWEWHVTIMWSVACSDGKVRYVEEEITTDSLRDPRLTYLNKDKEIPEWVNDEIENQIKIEKGLTTREEIEKKKEEFIKALGFELVYKGV